MVDRLLARLMSGRLDGDLSAGRPPEWSRLHSARADHLVPPPFRIRFADDSHHLPGNTGPLYTSPVSQTVVAEAVAKAVALLDPDLLPTN
jgi:hypothetical protein